MGKKKETKKKKHKEGLVGQAKEESYIYIIRLLIFIEHARKRNIT